MQPVNRPALQVRFFRFLIVGAVTAGTYAGTALLAENMGLALGLATTLGVVVSSLISYSGNHLWTFQAEGNHGRYFPRFMLVVAAGVALNQILIFVLVRQLHWPSAFVLGGFVIAMPLLNFLFHNIFSFREDAHGR